MDNANPIKDLDFHQLDLRYAHTRIRNDSALAKMQNSISRYGQIVPAVAVLEQDKYVLIDGYLRLSGLKACGHDCIKVHLGQEEEAESLFVLLAKNNDRQWEVIEEASLIQELHSRFSYSFGEIAHRLGRDKSWVKRRLDLVTSLPTEIKESVMTGKVSTWSASHVLLPLSRVNEKDACLLTRQLQEDHLSTRELASLYQHYKKSNRAVRDRLIAEPGLFAKTLQQQEEQKSAKQINDGPEGKWLKDISIVCHMLKRLISSAKYVFYPKQNSFERRQRQIWIEQAEKKIIELKEQAGRAADDNTSLSTNNFGDGQQGSGHS